jgi:acetyl-CoA acetyltransferase
MSRLDCDIPVQGVAAFVLTTAERAKDHPHKPVYIAGYANSYGSDRRLHLNWTLDEMEREGAALATRLWEGTGYTARDVQLPQLYDGFSPFIYVWLEALGYVPRGEAHALVAEGGIDSDRPGAIPVLTGGGAIGCGRLHGLPQMLECYRQLAGRAGERQRDVSVALMSYSAPHIGGAVVYTNDPA